MSLIREDKIKEMWQVGFMATASLVKYGQQTEARTCNEISVSLVFEKQKIISSTCSDCRSEVWCEHIIAACLYRIRNPKKVRVHAPMTEILSTLDRTQLQKLVQYAVENDPAGVLGKVFRHIDDVRDKTSEISIMAGAPDPTFGGLYGDKSQWQISLELLDKRLHNDLESMNRMRSFFDYADRRHEYYPDSFDVALKTKAKFFTYITPILELARQGEYMAAAEVMKHVAMSVISKMSTTSRSDCPSLSRLWHDISRIYSLLVLKTDDQAARNLLISTAEVLNRTSNVNDHLLGMSLWAELPSLCTLYPLETNKIREAGQVLVEPLIAGAIPACPKELKDLLEGCDTMNKSSYDEDLVTMIARLETVVYFEVEKSSQKIARLAFMVLHKLAILTQEDSVIGTYLPTSSSSGDGWNSPLLQALQSSGCLSEAKQLPLSAEKQSGQSKTARMCCTGNSKGKNPAKRFKKTPVSELITQAVLTKGQVAHAMMYTLRLLTSSSTQKGTNMDAGGRKLLTGFCLQALELSRHRTTAATNSITPLEQDWLLKLETYVCDYLQTSGAQDASDAVVMYVDAISAIGTNFYTASSGAYPLVLLEMLCHACTNNESLKTSKCHKVVKICSEILLNSTACLDAVTLPELRSFDLLIEAITDGTNVSSQRKHREFAIRKFHVITETFLSLVSTDDNQDIDLLVKILNHFESIKSVPLLKMISKDLRMHVWRFKEDNRVIEAMLRFSMHAYREAQLLLGFNSSDKQSESVEREFIFNLTRKLGILSLAIFSQGWQSIFSCKEFQELIMIIEPKVKEIQDSPLPSNVINVIMEFCDAKCFHEEDACALLTTFFKPGDTNFCTAIGKIIENADNFHAGALFHLAQLQQAQKRGRKGIMSADVFAIVEKAVEKITQITPKILEYIDWMFTSCVKGNRRDPFKSAFLSKMVAAVCSRAQSHPEIILRLLQNVEQHQQGLVRHAATSELGSALVMAYREHFSGRFRDCGHAAYATVIAEMQRARLECKHYVKNGETDFDTVVVEHIRRTHHTKKKLMKLLLQEFQPSPKST